MEVSKYGAVLDATDDQMEMLNALRRDSKASAVVKERKRLSN